MKTDNQHVSVLFMLFGILFCVCLITANVLETKQISLGPVNITGGLLVFPVSYIINDCVCEVWGYGRARMLIWTGFAMNFLFVLFGAVADAIPRCSVLGWRRGISCRIRPGTAHCRSLVCGFSRRIVHQCLCNEPYEGVVGRP